MDVGEKKYVNLHDPLIGVELCENGCGRRCGFMGSGGLGWWVVERGLMKMGRVVNWLAAATV